MTKEDLIRQICNWFSNDGYDNHKIKDVTEKFTQFFESNVCIPKGTSTNRHPYADVLHQFIEDISTDLEYLDPYYKKWNRSVFDTDANYEYRIKPIEPVYEWQTYYICTTTRKLVIVKREETDDYFLDGEIPNHHIRVEETKRERH